MFGRVNLEAFCVDVQIDFFLRSKRLHTTPTPPHTHTHKLPYPIDPKMLLASSNCCRCMGHVISCFTSLKRERQILTLLTFRFYMIVSMFRI